VKDIFFSNLCKITGGKLVKSPSVIKSDTLLKEGREQGELFNIFSQEPTTDTKTR
jgi:hypothetical protein